MPKKLTTEEFKKQLKLEHPNLELLSEYNGNKNYVTVKCIKHNYIFKTKPNWLHSGNGCQKCYDEKRGKSLRKTIDDFVKTAKEVHGDKYGYSRVNYSNNKTKVCIICPEHGEFWQRPDKHIQGEGCPICNNSKLELSLKKFLDDNKVNYEQQKQFKWLGKQKLDFYLPEYKIAIECQGIQHFISIPHFGGTEEFNNRVIRDITKKRLCDENNVKLIYLINEKDIMLSKKRKFYNIYNENNTLVNEKIERIKNILKL